MMPFHLVFLFSLYNFTAGIILYEFIPNNIGLSKVDLYMKFGLTKTLPPGSIIAIGADFAAFSHSDGDIKDYCWSSIDYTSCAITSNNIEITIANNIPLETPMMFYIDNAFDFTSQSSGVFNSGFSILVSWQGVTIAQDLSTANPVTIGGNAAETVTDWWLIVDNPTIGDMTNYGFNFTTGATVSPGDQILIKFDRLFNPWIAEPGELDITDKNDISYYYVDCFSYTLGNIQCTAGHWYINVTGISNTINPGNLADIWVKNILTPDLSLIYMIMYIFNSASQLKSYSENDGHFTVANSLPASSIYIKSVTLSDNMLWDTSNYYFEFYLDFSVSLTNDHAFFILFPQQYDFNSNNTVIPCSASYVEDGGSPYMDPWVTSQSCYFYNNYAIFRIPSGASSYSFSPTTKVSINLYGIKNPRWGKINPWTTTWGDTNFYGNTYYVSDKFEIEIFQESTSQVLARSYGSMHNGYAGLNKADTSVFKFQCAQNCKVY